MASCSQARPLSPTHAAIIGGYLIIFKPLMESFSTGRRARLCRGSAQSRDATGVLEALLQCHVPGSPLDIGCLFVVAVFTDPGYDPGYEGRCQVENVIHPEGDRCAIQPCTPSARIVLRGRDRHDILVLTAFHLRILAAVLGVAGDFVLRSGLWEVERVVQNPIQRSPFPNLARSEVLRGILKIPILADVVHDESGIDSSQR